MKLLILSFIIINLETIIAYSTNRCEMSIRASLAHTAPVETLSSNRNPFCKLEIKTFFSFDRNTLKTFIQIKAPSTRIRIFSNPQHFLSGYGYRPHASGELDSESGKK